MNKWIKCSERLPEKNGRYLVVESWSGNIWIGVSSFREGNFDILDIIHWMPLPEPPDGK